jgi:hypothetical protein
MYDPLPREIGTSLLLWQRDDTQGGRGRAGYPPVRRRDLLTSAEETQGIIYAFGTRMTSRPQ